MEEPNLLQTPETSSPSPEGSVKVEQEPPVEQEPRREVAESEEATGPQETQEAEPTQEVAEAPSVAPQVQQPRVQKDALTREIEEVLSEDLGEIYLRLPDDQKAAFKAKGEETATNVHNMFRSGKVQVRKILGWIRDWLRMIPSVNKFFLEQEAKIKTDKLLEVYKDASGDTHNPNAI